MEFKEEATLECYHRGTATHVMNQLNANAFLVGKTVVLVSVMMPSADPKIRTDGGLLCWKLLLHAR